MATTMAIADARYLWSEVDRLKSQVAELQAAEKRVAENQTHIRDYVASFVTHAQLDAALCTKISQSSVITSVDKLRVELLEALTAKADCESVLSLQSKKLDISVYESATWDLKKLRAALEQSLRDLFAGFAHQIEAQVSSKVSLEDFNLIFNPDANGQKEAIETAASRISRMKDQLEALQEYVSADRLRQHKVADLNVSVLDLTRKHNASRNAVAQLISSAESLKERMTGIEAGDAQLASHVTAIDTSLRELQAHSELEKARQSDRHTHMTQEVQDLQVLSQKLVQSLEQIQHFTRDTLLKSFDAKVKRASDEFHRGLDDLSIAQRQQAQAVSSQLSKANEKLQHHMEQIVALDSRLRALGTRLRDVNAELETVKGPLATLAANLREENVAILHEIQRSQNESREIMLDYQELLEKEQQQQLVPSASASIASHHPPSRPASSSAVRVASAYTSRKHKQQVLAMGSTHPNNSSAPRPHTSTPAAARMPVKASDPATGDPGRSNNNSQMRTATTSGVRAQTAGATPKQTRDLPPTAAPPSYSSTLMDSQRRRSLLTSLNNDSDDREAGDGVEPLFRFPAAAAVSPLPSNSKKPSAAAASPETDSSAQS